MYKIDETVKKNKNVFYYYYFFFFELNVANGFKQNHHYETILLVAAVWLVCII